MLTLNVEPREAGHSLKTIRKEGFLPAVIYGHGFKSQSLKINKKEFLKVLGEAGESTLIDLQIPGQKATKVLIQDVQRDAVLGDPIHADLYSVKMDETMEANIPLVFVGDSKAIKELGGVLVKTMHEVKVICLPGDLPHEISIDLSKLDNFGDAVFVKDLIVNKGVKIDLPMDAILAVVNKPKEEVVEQPVVAAAEVPVAGKEEKAAEGEGVEKKADDKAEKKDKK